MIVDGFSFVTKGLKKLVPSFDGMFESVNKIFGKGFNGTKNAFRGKLKEEFSDQVKKYTALAAESGTVKAAARNSWRILKTPLYEGFVEEGGQKLLDISGQNAAVDWYLSKDDPTHRGMVASLIDNVDNSFAAAYGSKEGQKEIGIGFILAALGLPGYSRSKKGYQHMGGMWGTWQDMKKEQSNLQAFEKIMNENPNAFKAIENHFNTLAREGVNEDRMTMSQLIDSEFGYKNAQHDSVFGWIANKLDAGFEESIYDDIKSVED